MMIEGSYIPLIRDLLCCSTARIWDAFNKTKSSPLEAFWSNIPSFGSYNDQVNNSVLVSTESHSLQILLNFYWDPSRCDSIRAFSSRLSFCPKFPCHRFFFLYHKIVLGAFYFFEFALALSGQFQINDIEFNYLVAVPKRLFQWIFEDIIESSIFICSNEVISFRNKEYVAVKVCKSATVFTAVAQDEIKLLQCTRDKNPDHPGSRNIVQMLDFFNCRSINGNHTAIAFEIMGPSLLHLIIQSDYQGIHIPGVKTIVRQVKFLFIKSFKPSCQN